MNIPIIPKSERFSLMEDAHLEYCFQCSDIEKNYNPDRKDNQWSHFTDNTSAVLGLVHEHDNRTILVLRRPIGESLNLLADLMDEYSKICKLNINGLSKEQLIELSKISTLLPEDIITNAIQDWENEANQKPHYFLPGEKNIILFKTTYEWQDIIQFDPGLEGKNYKTIRKSVNKAKREGLSFKPVKDTDLPELEILYNQWNLQLEKKEKRNDYINPYIFEKNPLFRSYFVKDKDEKTLAWTTLFTRGKYAYMVKRFALYHTSRPADYMDYNLFCLIKDEMIERLDRGMISDKAISQYKSKISPLKAETLYDISFLR